MGWVRTGVSRCPAPPRPACINLLLKTPRPLAPAPPPVLSSPRPPVLPSSLLLLTQHGRHLVSQAAGDGHALQRRQRVAQAGMRHGVRQQVAGAAVHAVHAVAVAVTVGGGGGAEAARSHACGQAGPKESLGRWTQMSMEGHRVSMRCVPAP